MHHVVSKLVPHFVCACRAALRSACGGVPAELGKLTTAKARDSIWDALQLLLSAAGERAIDRTHSAAPAITSWAVHDAYDAMQPARKDPAAPADLREVHVLLQRCVAINSHTSRVGVCIPRDMRRWWLAQPHRDLQGHVLHPLLPTWIGRSLKVYVWDVHGNMGSVTSTAVLPTGGIARAPLGPPPPLRRAVWRAPSPE